MAQQMHTWCQPPWQRGRSDQKQARRRGSGFLRCLRGSKFDSSAPVLLPEQQPYNNLCAWQQLAESLDGHEIYDVRKIDRTQTDFPQRTTGADGKHYCLSSQTFQKTGAAKGSTSFTWLR
jgi:hypothetical protein